MGTVVTNEINNVQNGLRTILQPAQDLLILYIYLSLSSLKKWNNKVHH